MILSALRVLPAAALVALALYMYIAYGAFRMQKRRLPLVRHTALYLLTGVGVMLIYATILYGGNPLNFSSATHTLNLRLFAWWFEPYRMGVLRTIEQLFINFVMFFPLGVLLPIAFPAQRGFWRTALTCLAITLAIETLQYYTGRCADIDDVLFNALGGIAGYALYAHLGRQYGQQPWFHQALGLGSEIPASPGQSALQPIWPLTIPEQIPAATRLPLPPAPPTGSASALSQLSPPIRPRSARRPERRRVGT